MIRVRSIARQNGGLRGGWWRATPRDLGPAGAGDAFSAAYLAERLKNQPVKEAVAAARRLAAAVARRPGAIISRASIPDL